jgi:hypothetical protein
MYTDFWLKIIKYLTTGDLMLLRMVSKRFYRIIKIKQIPIGREWARTICDNHMIEWFLTNSIIRMLYLEYNQYLAKCYINGHAWEQVLYTAIGKLGIVNINHGKQFIQNCMIYKDNNWLLNQTLLVENYVNLFRDFVLVTKNYIQIAGVAYNIDHCKLVIYDHIQLLLNWQIYGWNRVNEVLTEMGKKYNYPVDSRINMTRVSIVDTNNSYIKDIKEWKDLLSVRVMKTIWAQIRKKIRKVNALCTGVHICMICSLLTRKYIAPYYVCGTCGGKKGGRADAITSYLEASDFSHIQELNIRSGKQGIRIDFYIPGKYRDVIIECDQHQHINYGKRAELMRMWDIANSEMLIGRNICFIRFNPDRYKDHQQQVHDTDDLSRMVVLMKVMKVVLSTEATDRVEIIYMYYDGYDGTNICLPCPAMS